MQDIVSRIEGLQAEGDNFWIARALKNVSYPENAHRALSEIEASSFWFNHRNDVIAAVVANYPPEGPVFDIGGGNGYVSLGLKKAGFESIVVEPGEHGAETARSRGLPVIRAAYEELSVPDGLIPNAGLFDVLEHIEDDRAALADLHRAIAPGGMFYVAVPAYQFLWSEDDRFAGHYRRYTLPRLRERLMEAGFEPLYETYFFSLVVGAQLGLRVIPTRLGLKKKKTQADTGAHRLPGGPVGAVFNMSFREELKRIRAGGSAPFGTSCLIAARRP